MKELEDMGLSYRESDSPQREKIDFTIYDGEDNVAWVWGNSKNDLDWECSHPQVEYEDDESVGECVLCGSYCDWHEETYGDDGYIAKDRVPHNWYPRKSLGGVLEKIVGDM